MGYRTVALSSSASKEGLATELGAHDYIDGSKVDQADALQKLGGAKVGIDDSLILVRPTLTLHVCLWTGDHVYGTAPNRHPKLDQRTCGGWHNFAFGTCRRYIYPRQYVKIASQALRHIHFCSSTTGGQTSVNSRMARRRCKGLRRDRSIRSRIWCQMSRRTFSFGKGK
jgi:hypothetical protein